MIAVPIVIAAIAAALAISFFLSRALSTTYWLHDTPNERSAHTQATPRSGGIAIFAGWFAAIIGLSIFAAFTKSPETFFLFAGFGFLAFLIGFVDDWVTLSAKGKLLAQVLVATAFTLMFGPAATIPAPLLGEVALGPLAAPLTIFWIVAFMNAFNFMDGVNGLASSCGAFVAASLAIVAASAGGEHWAAPAVLLAVAIFGFLPSNLNTGKLFMGDGGSQSIGFLIAALAILISKDAGQSVSLLFAPTAFMPFLLDVFMTLIARARRGANLFAAHNEHFYQRLAARGWTHVTIAATYLAAVLVSTAAAAGMNFVDPAYQFLAPLGLAILFVLAAQFLLRDENENDHAGDIAPAPSAAE